jgi:hypothetical protein
MGLGWLFGGRRRTRRARPATVRRAQRDRLQVEVLEDRCVPAMSVSPASPAALVANLTGPGIKASNIVYKGNAQSSGIFTGASGTGLGFDAGIILSSGHAAGVVGPNTGNTPSNANGLPGDSQLATLAGTTLANTFDATTLSFDFIPIGHTLTFTYVFGSSEYNEFVNSQFNDVFGFLLNGNDVARLPNGTIVSINNVNDGNPIGTGASNPKFYRNNEPGNPAGFVPKITVNLNGFTVVLTVTAAVNQGKVNHIKLGVSDVGDNILDSDVFIKAGSFISTQFLGHVYHPLRYTYNPSAQTYRGNVEVVNNAFNTALGPFFLVFPNLPQGVKLQNATATSKSGKPYIRLNVSQMKPGQIAYVPIVLTNPLHLPLSTFLQGFEIDVLQQTPT